MKYLLLMLVALLSSCATSRPVPALTGTRWLIALPPPQAAPDSLPFINVYKLHPRP